MNEPPPDLFVACHPAPGAGSDIAFTAERLSPPPASHWILFVESDQVAVEITRLTPAALGHILDTGGVLGLLFPATVTSVQVEVAPGRAAEQCWRFWVDDDVPRAVSAATSVP
jgi:hypothetical protein